MRRAAGKGRQRGRGMEGWGDEARWLSTGGGWTDGEEVEWMWRGVEVVVSRTG